MGVDAKTRAARRGAGTVCSKCGEREAWSRGLCNRCYTYERKAGTLPKIHGKEIPRVLMRPDDVKRCRTCGEEKSGVEFWADKSARDGKQSQCRSCNTIQSADWKRNNPDGARAIRHRRRERARGEWRGWKYGLSPEDFDAMEKAQGGVCAVCGNPPKATKRNFLVVDHDHGSGEVRGLLCSGCNTGLGLFGDGVEGLQRAIDYLQRSAK